MQRSKNLTIGCLCALGCELLFGFSYLFTKNATASASAFALMGWRFLIAIIVMGICAATRLMKIELKGKSLKPLLIVALLSPVIYFIGETFGISMTTASESGAFLACIPVASVVASTLILRKKPTKQQTIGILEENFALLPDSIDKAYVRKTGVDHGDSHLQFDGYMTAWFRYYLMGDEEAGNVFYGEDAELISNQNYQDVRIQERQAQE